ncbi:MAG: AI-2E family transporter [Alphaproteobacteria bacterium]|nr:AI-2E family transporter [Alphaproteobacteria bacterium]
MSTITKPQAHLMFWGATALLFFGFVWIFKGVLTPFVLGIAIAYLLEPVVGILIKLKLPRIAAVLLILLSFFIFVAGVLAFAGPPLAREAAGLAESIPGYVDQFVEFLTPYLTSAQEKFGGDYVENLKTFLQSNAGKVIQVTGGVASGLASGGQAVVGFLTTVLLTPLVAFFMMQEWPRVTAWINDLIPREKERMIKDLLSQMNAKVSGFVRGQITVAFFLAVINAEAHTIADLNYGFLIGISAGVLSIIPMVGSFFGLFVSLIVAWFQAGELSYVGIIAAIFVAGQIIEGNILSPKIIGDSVGLHPLWIIFALMAGGSLFGILGMLLAVPVAAVIGVLVSFAILQYKASPLYKKSPPKAKPIKKSVKKKVKKAAKKAVKKSTKKTAKS